MGNKQGTETQFAQLQTYDPHDMSPEAKLALNKKLLTCSQQGEISKLLDQGADPRYVDEHGKNLLHMTNNADIIRMLLECTNGPNVNSLDNNGYTPLMIQDDPAVIGMLLEHGADPNLLTRDGRTALMMHNDLEIADMLLDAGADVNAIDQAGQTALFYVDDTDEGDVLLTMLLSRGANPLYENNDGLRVLQKQNRYTAMKILLQHEFQWNGEYGPSEQLIFARESEIRRLLAEGANPNKIFVIAHPQIPYVVPLVLISDYGVAKLLVEHGADVEHVLEIGRSVLGKRRTLSLREYQTNVLEKKMRIEELGQRLILEWEMSPEEIEQMEENECPICFCDMTKEEKISMLVCAHVYHRACFEDWLEKNGDDCPSRCNSS